MTNLQSTIKVGCGGCHTQKDTTSIHSIKLQLRATSYSQLNHKFFVDCSFPPSPPSPIYLTPPPFSPYIPDCRLETARAYDKTQNARKLFLQILRIGTKAQGPRGLWEVKYHDLPWHKKRHGPFIDQSVRASTPIPPWKTRDATNLTKGQQVLPLPLRAGPKSIRGRGHN